MPSILSSPVKKHPGTVTLKPLVLPLFFKWQDSFLGQEQTNSTRRLMNYVPVICDCVEKWELKGFPAEVTSENWPAEDIKSKMEVVTWLIGELSDRFFGTGDSNPNE
jgi:hypothetical protein